MTRPPENESKSTPPHGPSDLSSPPVEPARRDSTSPVSRRHAELNMTATMLFSRARQCFEEGALDDAVRHAEQLLELAVYHGDPAVLRVLGSAITTLDMIFEERVSPASCRVAPGPAIGDVRRLKLSPRAAQLLSQVEGPMPVPALLDAAHVPRREGIRLIAGLLRRRALQRC
jgi:hypothetical protein